MKFDKNVLQVKYTSYDGVVFVIWRRTILPGSARICH